MNTGQKLAYGLLGAPLAMAALPVYVYTPKLYGDEFGLGLALTGVILLGSRVVDTLQDPWLGRLANHMQQKPGGWPVLALGLMWNCRSPVVAQSCSSKPVISARGGNSDRSRSANSSIASNVPSISMVTPDGSLQTKPVRLRSVASR